MDPAIAAVLGAGAVLAARRWVLAAAGGVLPGRAPRVSVGAVAHRVEDSGTPGALPPARVAALPAWGRARAARSPSAVARGAQLVAAGDRDVVFLAAGRHPLVTPAGLAAGRVHAALLGGACGATGRGCTAAEAWIRAHGTDVSAGWGSRRPAWPGTSARRNDLSGTRTSGASRRSRRRR